MKVAYRSYVEEISLYLKSFSSKFNSLVTVFMHFFFLPQQLLFSLEFSLGYTLLLSQAISRELGWKVEQSGLKPAPIRDNWLCRQKNYLPCQHITSTSPEFLKVLFKVIFRACRSGLAAKILTLKSFSKEYLQLRKCKVTLFYFCFNF